MKWVTAVGACAAQDDKTNEKNGVFVVAVDASDRRGRGAFPTHVQAAARLSAPDAPPHRAAAEWADGKRITAAINALTDHPAMFAHVDATQVALSKVINRSNKFLPPTRAASSSWPGESSRSGTWNRTTGWNWNAGSIAVRPS
jgi:hypothetical protein